MTKIEIYIVIIACLCVGAAGGWFAGKADIIDKGIKCEISTAMPPKPGLKN